MTLNFFSQILVPEVPDFEKFIPATLGTGLILDCESVQDLPWAAVTVNYGCLKRDYGLYTINQP